MNSVLTLSLDRWTGPFDEDLGRRAVYALERGAVLYFPHLSFALSDPERAAVEQAVAGASGGGAGKNVSYDPASGACKAGPVADATAAALAAPMARFARQAEALVTGLAPDYAPGLELARGSFRPVEVEGRALSWRKDDRRLHVDAFPSRPLRGRRILRVFSNADPAGGPRRWLVGEAFEAHARRFHDRLPRPNRSQAWLLSRLGLTHGLRSPYDQVMLALHDAAKRDDAYQAAAEAQVQDFPAGSTWIAYTDQTPHAALRGRCAFEQTFYVRPEVLQDPPGAPLAVLQRLAGQPLL